MCFKKFLSKKVPLNGPYKLTAGNENTKTLTTNTLTSKNGLKRWNTRDSSLVLISLDFVYKTLKTLT